MIRIALYSEDRTLQPLFSSALGKEFLVHQETEREAMRNLIMSGECDVAILELNSSRDSLQRRLEFARALITLQAPLILMADDSLRATAFDLIRAGAFGYCRRPPSIRNLKSLLMRATSKPAANLPESTPEACDRLIGSSPKMQKVYQLIQRVTNLNAAVLINGESGTGKELIARAIHNMGNRANRPFVAVSCGAIPETLIEAELFGHEKGAFTGTVGAREGFFEQVGEGTLFLDEIGDLTLYTQVKLLRVLQQMEFSRLGSTRLIPLRARLIFATHQDLAKLVAEGKFRQDLYYRINVMQIVSPSLRDHREDIPLIARHFIQHYSEVFQKPVADIDPEALTLLQNYSWPGNVRELENAMQRAIILAPKETVRSEDFQFGPHEEEPPEDSEVVDFSDYHPSGSFERKLRDYKVKLAVAAVRENHGNKTLAARSLCISRAYLHRLLRLADPPLIEEASLQDEETA
jgi:DNA-binding NtrC family response regulator